MKPTNLSIVERQILSNQFRILAKIENNERYEILSEILEDGYTGEYDSIFSVNTDETDYQTCSETNKILNMFRRINYAIENLSDQEKSELDLDSIKFTGFDGNNGSHYFYMTFMVEKLNKWQEYSGQYLNSHSQLSLIKYRKMLEYNQELLDNKKYDLDIEDLRIFISLI